MTCVIALFSLIALTLQPPAPSPTGSKGRRAQAQTQQTTTKTAADPQAVPLPPLVVKIEPAPKTGDETAKELRKEQREAAAYEWTVAGVVMTGLVGFLTVGIIGYQVRIAAK